MWQSAGKFMPRVDQLVKVAEPIIEMGCFDRVETNGGGFEQINLLAGQDPNHCVREWTQPFNDAGIETQMLERGLNAIRMSPVSKDVRKLMFKVKKLQGTDVSRTFDGLNNPRNLALSFQYAKEGGMIAQGALSLTYSPVHTVDYYINLAVQYIEAGAEEICIKDMAGIGRPVSVGKIVKGIKDRHPEVLVQYHGHSTPGFSVASSLEAARNGADYIDVGMEPLSWGTGHADLLTIHEMLRDAGFSVKDINTKAYMQARALSQEFIEDFLGAFINPRNRYMNSLLIGPGLPGGMMGSLMADLENNLKSINKWKTKRDLPTLTQEDLLLKLFAEVKYVWPKLGYPPLVTPFSQYVKNTAMVNVMQMEKGKERFSMMDENTWGMILGRSGELLGDLDPEILKLAKEQNREFYTDDPQDLYPDVLDDYRAKMKEKGWDTGKDDEELLEYALHEPQYEDYKSGRAKERFEAALAEKRGQQSSANVAAVAVPAVAAAGASSPKTMTITVDGQPYKVDIDYGTGGTADSATPVAKAAAPAPPVDDKNAKYVDAPIEGKFFLTKESGERGIQVGDVVKKGDTVGYIESMKVINAIAADTDGTVVEILAKHGADIDEDDHIVKLS